jgi:hypothetical protein
MFSLKIFSLNHGFVIIRIMFEILLLSLSPLSFSLKNLNFSNIEVLFFPLVTTVVEVDELLDPGVMWTVVGTELTELLFCTRPEDLLD